MYLSYKKSVTAICLLAAVLLSSCQQAQDLSKPTVVSSTLRNVPAQRLSYRFEADVLAPPGLENSATQPEKLSAIQAHFDQNRPQDALERTIASPDKQRVLAVYQMVADEPVKEISGQKELYRLDLYDANGALIRKVTPDNMAVSFPDTITWSPDSTAFAFSGARRANMPASQEIVQEAPRPPDLEGEPSPNANVSPIESPSPSPIPLTVLTFRAEQIYLANRDGLDLKPLTQTEGLIYFYTIWSPDGTMLASLACRENEWQILQARAGQAGEIFKPLGRPRLLEKNGRERRLDDGLTGVYPVWSPDSSKVALAFDKQLRIYDAVGNAPTAASIPLQVPLLIASKVCDDKTAANQSCVNSAPSEVNANNAANLPTTEPTTFLPVVSLRWAEDPTLYLQTGYIKDFVQGEPVRSYLRWHRLNLSPQAAVLK